MADRPLIGSSYISKCSNTSGGNWLQIHADLNQLKDQLTEAWNKRTNVQRRADRSSTIAH